MFNFEKYKVDDHKQIIGLHTVKSRTYSKLKCHKCFI